MAEYVTRAAQLRAMVDGESTEDVVDSPLGSVGYYPALTGETVKADGQAHRVALYDFEVAHRDSELDPHTVTPVKAGDVALLSQAQADRLEAIGFVMGEADFKAATTGKKTRKS